MVLSGNSKLHKSYDFQKYSNLPTANNVIKIIKPKC